MLPNTELPSEININRIADLLTSYAKSPSVQEESPAWDVSDVDFVQHNFCIHSEGTWIQSLLSGEYTIGVCQISGQSLPTFNKSHGINTHLVYVRIEGTEVLVACKKNSIKDGNLTPVRVLALPVCVIRKVKSQMKESFELYTPIELVKSTLERDQLTDLLLDGIRNQHQLALPGYGFQNSFLEKLMNTSGDIKSILVAFAGETDPIIIKDLYTYIDRALYNFMASARYFEKTDKIQKLSDLEKSFDKFFNIPVNLISVFENRVKEIRSEMATDSYN